MEFLFDKFMKLAVEDPEAFEKLREELLRQVIENTRPQIQQRLEDMQCRIDQERSAAGSSMKGCVKIFDMMVDYFYNEYLPGAGMKVPVKKGKKLRVVR